MRRPKELSRQFVTILKQLSPSEMREVLRFVLFLKTRASIDPEQVYFFTRGWQRKEQAVARDKKLGRLIGDGTLEGLLDILHS